jgi:hypothetical protein
MPRRPAPSVKVLLAALRSTLTAQTATARWLLGFAKQSHALLAKPLFSQPARCLGEYHKKNLHFEHREYLDNAHSAKGGA